MDSLTGLHAQYSIMVPVPIAAAAVFTYDKSLLDWLDIHHTNVSKETVTVWIMLLQLAWEKKSVFVFYGTTYCSILAVLL